MVTWRITFPLECLGVLTIHMDHRTLSPLLGLCPFLFRLVAVVGLICLVAPCSGCYATSIMMAKKAEAMRDRSRLLAQHFLCIILGSGGSGQRPTSESLRCLQSCKPHPLVPGPCTVSSLVPSFPAMLAFWAHPTPFGLRVGIPSNTNHSSHHTLPQRDLTFFLDCLY